MAPAMIIVPIALFFAAKQNKKTFKDLTDKFGTKEPMPPEAFVAYSFQYKQNSFRKKGIKMLERNRSLLIKIPFLDLIKIPFSEFKSVTTQELFLGMTIFEITLKDESLIRFRVNKNRISQVPELFKMSTVKQMTAEQKANLAALKDPALKSKITNILRGCGLIAVILITLVILRVKYGFGI